MKQNRREKELIEEQKGETQNLKNKKEQKEKSKKDSLIWEKIIIKETTKFRKNQKKFFLWKKGWKELLTKKSLKISLLHKLII